MVHDYPERLQALEESIDIDLSKVKLVWPLYDGSDAETATGYIYITKSEFEKPSEEKSEIANLLRGDHDRIQDVLHVSHGQTLGYSNGDNGEEITWRLSRKSGRFMNSRFSGN